MLLPHKQTAFIGPLPSPNRAQCENTRRMLVKLCTHKPLNIRIHLGSKLRSLLQGRRHTVATNYFASAGVAGLLGDRQYCVWRHRKARRSHRLVEPARTIAQLSQIICSCASERAVAEELQRRRYAILAARSIYYAWRTRVTRTATPRSPLAGKS